MFDHVKFGVSDYAASKAFFLQALEPLGIAIVSEGPPTYGVELCAKGKDSLCLFQTEEKPAHLHIAFTAESRRQVDAFHRAALKAGARDNGAPGLRPRYHANYYAAFVIGPDGHNIEVVCHEPDEPASSLAAETEALRETYAALNRNDIDAAVEPFDAEIAWIEPAEYGETCHGLAAVKEHLARARATWAEGRCEPERYVAAGDRIVVVIHVHVRLKHEQEWREGRHAAVYTFRDGKATEMRIFDDIAQGLVWAGMES